MSGGRAQLEALVTLSESEVRSRYGRGPWRLVKWLVDPFALVGVYLVVVSVVLKVGGTSPGLSLACTVVPFQLVMMAVSNGLDSISMRGAIIANMPFPRVLLPVASTLTETIAYLGGLALLGLMMAIYATPPTLAVLWLPAVFAANLAVAVALAYLASLIGLWIPDLRGLTISAMRTLYFLAPGLVALDQVGGVARDLMYINPLTGLFESYRSILLYGHAPAAWQLLAPVAIAGAGLAILLPVYRREQWQFAKVLA
jgi:ABC-type polysaccharide/polyol phosphate export permease